MSVYTYREKLWLYEQMKYQTEDDTFYIYRLLKKNGEDYTVNSNGVFFDMNRLSDDTIRELNMYYKVLRPLIEEKPFQEERRERTS